MGDNLKPSKKTIQVINIARALRLRKALKLAR